MIVIDYQNRKPIYEQIVEKFQLLTSVRSLAAELSINPNTIQKAYAILEQQGYIYPVKGRGNFVSGDRALKQQKEELYFGKLREVIKEGKELGIGKERCLSKAAEFYEEDEA